MRKICIYARVSTDEQAEVEEGSLKNQVASCKRYVDGENIKDQNLWGAVVDTYIDDGYSGKNLNRPEMKRLLLDISKKRIDTVIITEIARWSRKVRDWIDTISFFDEHEVTLILLRQKFDTSTAMGRAMFNLAIEFAQLEREITAERVKASYNERIRRGLWPGCPPPYGLDITYRPGYLKVNVAKQIIANEILEIYLNKAGSLQKTADFLTEAKYTRAGNLLWDVSSLARWIKQRALIGEIEINYKNMEKDQSKLADMEKYNIVKTVWKPVVDREKWMMANELIKENYRKRKVSNWKHHEYLLTGLIECQNGRHFVGTSGWGRANIKYVSYKHAENIEGKCACGITNIPAKELDNKIIAELRKLMSAPKLVEVLVQKANEKFKAKQPDYKTEIVSINRKLSGVIQKLDKITDEILESESANEKKLWIEKSNRLQKQKEDIEREINILKQQKDKQTGNVMNPQAISDILEKFNNGFDNLPVAAKQSYIRAVLSKVIVEKDKFVLHLKSPDLLMERESLTSCVSGDKKIVDCLSWGDRRGLNPRHPEPQSSALPTELRPPPTILFNCKHNLQSNTLKESFYARN